MVEMATSQSLGTLEKHSIKWQDEKDGWNPKTFYLDASTVKVRSSMLPMVEAPGNWKTTDHCFSFPISERQTLCPGHSVMAW
jgi:hypothetical protein